MSEDLRKFKEWLIGRKESLEADKQFYGATQKIQSKISFIKEALIQIENIEKKK